MQLPLFTDLRAVADALASDPHFRRLRPTIERAGRIDSCVADLRQALASCEAMNELINVSWPGDRHLDVTVVNALTHQAVIFYARATATSGKGGERGSIKINSRLTKDQITDHETLIDMRNRVIAHVYPGEKIHGVVMRQERVFLVKTTESTPLIYTGIVGFDPLLSETLNRQLPVALSIVREQMLEELDKVMTFFDSKAHPFGIFMEHLVDPISVYGSIEGVFEAIKGIEVGFTNASRRMRRPKNDRDPRGGKSDQI